MKKSGSKQTHIHKANITDGVVHWTLDEQTLATWCMYPQDRRHVAVSRTNQCAPITSGSYRPFLVEPWCVKYALQKHTFSYRHHYRRCLPSIKHCSKCHHYRAHLIKQGSWYTVKNMLCLFDVRLSLSRQLPTVSLRMASIAEAYLFSFCQILRRWSKNIATTVSIWLIKTCLIHCQNSVCLFYVYLMLQHV